MELGETAAEWDQRDEQEEPGWEGRKSLQQPEQPETSWAKVSSSWEALVQHDGGLWSHKSVTELTQKKQQDKT